MSELEARLAKYENAHTPPSLRRGRNRKKDKDHQGKPGKRSGIARPNAVLDSHVEVTADRCPDCGIKLGAPFRIESKIIEERDLTGKVHIGHSPISISLKLMILDSTMPSNIIIG
jgi:hypothetical protein